MDETTLEQEDQDMFNAESCLFEIEVEQIIGEDPFAFLDEII